jgi:hypothetical protein
LGGIGGAGLALGGDMTEYDSGLRSGWCGTLTTMRGGALAPPAPAAVTDATWERAPMEPILRGEEWSCQVAPTSRAGGVHRSATTP